MPHSHVNPFLHQNQPSQESIFWDKVGGWWVKMALFVLNVLLKSGQSAGLWVAKPISIWRGKLVGVGLSGFAGWPRYAGCARLTSYSRFASYSRFTRFASCSRFTSYPRFTRFASCSRFTSYPRFTRFSSYPSPTSSARSSVGAVIFFILSS